MLHHRQQTGQHDYGQQQRPERHPQCGAKAQKKQTQWIRRELLGAS